MEYLYTKLNRTYINKFYFVNNNYNLNINQL